MITAERSKVLSGLVEFYKDVCKPELETIEQELVDIFKEVIDKSREDYKLEFLNSVYKGKYFKFSSRVKSEESISEKLVRNSDLLYLISHYNLTVASDIDLQRRNLKQFFINYEDIIGVKIIGDLNVDSQRVFNLIKENVEEFTERGITFFDIEQTQPQSMKNGLPIFKVKAVFNNSYSFELQIKSQLESAWGDMEHQLFYKDYEFTPVKDSVQNIMNQIGKLLKEVDNLLYSIRVTESNYKEKEELSSFKSNLYKSYSQVIKKYLNIPHDQNLGEISIFLFGLHKLIIDQPNLLCPDPIVKFDFTDYNLESEDGVLSNFNELKSNNFDLQVFEFILLNWLNLTGHYNEDEQTYNSSLKNYFKNVYREYLFRHHDIEDDEIFSYVYNGILSKANNKNIFLGAKEFYQITSYYKVAIDIYNEKYSNEDPNEIYLNMFKNIPIIYGLYKFGNDLKYSISEFEEVFEYDFVNLNQQYEYFKDYIQIMKESNPDAYEENKGFIEDNRKIINIFSEIGSEEE